MTDLSEPRIEVDKYTILPTGFDQSPFTDTRTSFCVYVERYPDTGRWRVYDGHHHGLILSRKTGKWVRDRPQVRHLTRFEPDELELALEMAQKHVDDRPFRNLPEIIRSRRENGLD